MPLVFRHLSSENINNRYEETNSKIDKHTCRYKARLQTIASAQKVLVQLLEQVAIVGIPAKHVLMDY
ncbi:MAG: hypothetical protein GYA02_11360 [Clostridiaceae bacterium]|nr:hypothetical protein [Clostridiaceae bacterium]